MPGYSRGRLHQVEPVQWAIDFLNYCFNLKEEVALEDYWLSFLQEERLFFQQNYGELLSRAHKVYHNIFWSDGYLGGSLLVLRLLLNTLPTVLPCRCMSKKILSLEVTRVLKEAKAFLQGLNLTPEPKSPGKNVFLLCLEILEKKGFPLRKLARGNTPLLVVSLPYRENSAGCYLAPIHTIACFGHPPLSPEEQLTLFLHEIGHSLFLQKRWPKNSLATARPGGERLGEVFAHRFALTYKANWDLTRGPFLENL